MDVRPATEDDLDALHDLLRTFVDEVPLPDHVDQGEEAQRRFIEEYVDQHVALLAEEDGTPTGFLLARMKRERLGYVSDLYVTREARRLGVAGALLLKAAEELRGRGAQVVALDVFSSNDEARAIYERWGFCETRIRLEVAADELETRLSSNALEPSHGLVFVQTDDESAVDKAARTFLPRLGRSPRTDVHPAANGWIAIDDELCSGDRELLRRLAQELSYRTGGVVLTLGVEEGSVVRYVLFDRGSIADEYASVPEYHGPLPPGDVVALSANPTVAHRLTGADPERVRAVARTAASTGELQPAEELYAELADVLGVPLP
jgi:ribosomal protein S18 acetylase RimI-like enzyme